MHIKKSYFVTAAGCMWLIAGINIFHIGLQTWHVKETKLWLHFAGVAITLLFFSVILKGVYKKNVIRISNMKDSRNPFSFFNIRGWMIIGFMITLGITIRHFGLLPETVIASFYQGLGAILVLYGGKFLWTAISLSK